MRVPLGLLLFALVAQTGTASAQTWSPEQQEIWRLEDQQWKMGAAKVLTWIDTMVHPNISFWDRSFPTPQNKASLSRWAKYGSANGTILEQEIFPISVTITGNVAVAHYHYRVASENYKKERETATSGAGHRTERARCAASCKRGSGLGSHESLSFRRPGVG